jgi:hypothetical protein
MAKQLFFRTASAAGLLGLALLFVGLDPFLSAGADLTNAFSVDRSFKGDRLPISDQTTAPDWRNEFGSSNIQPDVQTPFACDAAFSMISSSSAANFYGRCIS